MWIGHPDNLIKPKNTKGSRVIISEQKSPVRIQSSKIHIRTDIFCEEANILNEDPEVEDVNEMDVESTTFEVSDKRRKFASKLATRSLQSLKDQKKNDEYLVSFYKIICPEKTKLESSSRCGSDIALQIVGSCINVLSFPADISTRWQ